MSAVILPLQILLTDPYTVSVSNGLMKLILGVHRGTKHQPLNWRLDLHASWTIQNNFGCTMQDVVGTQGQTSPYVDSDSVCKDGLQLCHSMPHVDKELQHQAHVLPKRLTG
jgi:hypothetical protein